MSQVFIILNLNGIVACSSVSVKDNELNAMIHNSFAQPRAFLLLRRTGGSHNIPLLDTDVSAPLSGYDVNCCDTDVSQSSGLCLRVHRHVLISSIPLSPALTVVDDL